MNTQFKFACFVLHLFLCINNFSDLVFVGERKGYGIEINSPPPKMQVPLITTIFPGPVLEITEKPRLSSKPPKIETTSTLIFQSSGTMILVPPKMVATSIVQPSTGLA